MVSNRWESTSESTPADGPLAAHPVLLPSMSAMVSVHLMARLLEIEHRRDGTVKSNVNACQVH